MNDTNHDKPITNTGGCCGGKSEDCCQNEPAQEPTNDHEVELEINDPIGELEAKLAEAEAKALRTLADFQNFQKRAANNEVEARRQGITSIVASLLPVMDNFDLALGQDISKMTAEQLLGGVDMVRAEMERALAQQGVTMIKPKKGDEFDPEIHEAVARHPDPEVELGCVIDSFQTGYKLGERVLRPAKVAVSAEQS